MPVVWSVGSHSNFVDIQHNMLTPHVFSTIDQDLTTVCGTISGYRSCHARHPDPWRVYTVVVNF